MRSQVVKQSFNYSQIQTRVQTRGIPGFTRTNYYQYHNSFLPRTVRHLKIRQPQVTDLLRMIEVKFNPSVAQLREVLRRGNVGTSPTSDCKLLANKLHSIDMCKEKLFLCLVFYTNQDLWDDQFSLYRALTCASTTLPPTRFIQLVEELGLKECYLKIPYLPLPVCDHLISLLSTHHHDTVQCRDTLESIVHNIIYKHTHGRHLERVVQVLVRNTSLSLGTLIDCLDWLSCESIRTEASDDIRKRVVTGYIKSVLQGNRVDYGIHNGDVGYREVIDPSDKLTVYEEVLTVISTHYSTHYAHLLVECSGDIIETLTSTHNIESNTELYCECYHKLKGRLDVYQRSRGSLAEHGEAPELESQSIQLLIDTVSMAEVCILESEEFMMYAVRSATSPHRTDVLTLISQSILQYLTNLRVKELLLNGNLSQLLWTENQTKSLLVTLRSLQQWTEERSTISQDITSQDRLREDLTKVILEALPRLSSKSLLLKYEYLNDLSSYFNQSQCRSLTNLTLNRVRPQADSLQLVHTLTVLLCISPADVIKTFSYQLLKSKSALAAVMAKIYVSVMQTSMLPADVFKHLLNKLEFTEQQMEDLMSKCLLYFLQYECPVSEGMKLMSLSTLSLDNVHLMDHLKNIESVIRSAEENIDRLNVETMEALTFFTLSVVDSELMNISPPPQSKDSTTGLVRVSLRLLSTSTISQTFHNMRKKNIVQEFINSLHTDTVSYLRDEDVL